LKNKYGGWLIGAFLIATFIFVPLLFVLEGLYQGNNPNVQHIQKFVLSNLVFTTLRMVLGVSAVAILLGVPAAYFVANYSFPLHKFLKKANILPAAIPTYIMAFVYASIFSISGSFERFLTFFVDRQTIFDWNINVLTEGWLMVFLGFSLYPYVYSASLVSFSLKNKRVDEAAASLGAGPWKRFFKIILPISLPAIMSGTALVAMEVVNDYGAMSYFNVKTITAGIFQAKQMDYGSSLYLSALTFIVIVGLFTTFYLIRSFRKFTSPSISSTYDLIPTKGWRAIVISILVFLPFSLGFIFPLVELFILAGSKVDVVMSSVFFYTVTNSIQLAFIPAAIIVVLSLIMLYNNYLNPSRSVSLVTSVSTIGYAIPGAVIAVAVIGFVMYFDNESRSIYHFLVDGLILLMFAYVVRFMAVGYNTLYGGFNQISSSLPDASRSLGKSSLKTFLLVYFPLMRPAIFTTLALVTVDILKELPLTLLLQRFNFNTLATVTYEQAKINESVADASPYALLLIFVGVLAILVLVSTDRKSTLK
jgi:iron(III) transport system permease protein